MRISLIAAAMLAASGFAAPAHAVDFLGVPLWESWPGQYSAAPGHRYYYYAPPAYHYYDPYTGRYYRY